MFRKLLAANGFVITDAEFKTIMEITTDDIKFNRIGFKKLTSLNYVMSIATRSALIFKKCS